MRTAPTRLFPTILFEDTHLLVLSKPAGLLSQGERTGDENLVDWLRAYLGRPYVGLIHRLDRNTSGAMVVAKRSKAAERLTRQLQDGTLERSYLAWLEGRLLAAARWQHRLEKEETNNLVRVVKQGGRAASLTVEPVALGGTERAPLTLARFRLETGRSHQIRAQAAAMGHPLLGDTKYGHPASRTRFPRPALHSDRIALAHPISRERLEFEAPLPEDMRSIPITTYFVD